MSGSAQIWLAAGLAIAGVIVLRISWARRERSAALNLMGWSGFTISCGLAWSAFGAWGVAVAMLVATGVALILLAAAALKPVSAKRRNTAISRTAIEPAVRRSIRARFATFLVAGPLALIASLAAALAARSVVLILNGNEADANVTVLGMVPLIWAILSTILLMGERRRTQIVIATVITGLSAPFALLAGAG